MGILKRILFLYISISSGHQRAAESVMGAMHRINPRVSCHGIDSFTYAYPVIGPLVARMYLEVLKYTPQIWDYLYDNPSVMEATREIRELLNAFNARKICRLLQRFHPRCLVCTQAVPITVLATMKQSGKIKVPLVGIVTDYDVHSYWLSRHVDLYLVATEEIKRKMVREGIKEHRVHVTGIPVDPHFTTAGDKAEERRRLGLNPDRPTVLVMGGSRGLGPLEEVVARLRHIPGGVQVVAVCGENARVRKRFYRRFAADRSVRVFGFIKNLSRLMDASDLLISKPGGMTCAESMAKGLPLLMIQPIPGQEERNARYLLKHGAAERVDDLEELAGAVQHLLAHPDRLEKLRERALALSKPYAAFDAAETILKILKEPVLNRLDMAPELERAVAAG